MVTRTITTTVAEDGTIHLPEGAARPGDSVVVHVEQAEAPRFPAPEDDEYLTVSMIDTSEKREQFIRQVLAWGQRNRAQMTAEELSFDWDAWMYDENGLPH